MTKTLSILEQERNYLLYKWIKASGSEKAKLLVKIMDLEEQLEFGRESEPVKIG
ncbi:hypothetical protein RDV78_04140 [Bacillota bacterium LX-D]|nr:hypothetical protein [Bacillota bacterium LX-D]